MEQPTGDSSSRDQRRSERYEVLVPIHVSWTTPSGQTISDRAEVVEANQHGGLLVMRIYPPLGENIELLNLLSGEKSPARAVAFRHGPAASLSGVAVELIRPSGDFWGITYRLRRASSELKNLEEALKEGKGLDLRVLQEFRDAVDYVRKTAWVVYEWQERQAHHRDTATVMPLLTSERMRRATQLCFAILEDLASMRPERYPGEVSNFFEAVRLVHTKLDPLIGRNRPRVD
jgi:hypothetical protein